ncbi:hypothetical protein ABEB36_006500 [Hypothenemus hampei]|uniref:Uncharacterized protein n=1 Tax=Hypothenemus hampei TaxID=57062 RepID=A0ABD1EQR7_HYPHA
MFSVSGYHDMLLIYGETLQNSEKARTTASSWTNICPSFPKTFEYGNVIPEYQGRGCQREIDSEAEEQILNLVEEDSTRSSRSIARLVRVSNWTVHRMLKEQFYLLLLYTKETGTFDC